MNKLSNVVIGNNGLDIYTADEHFTPICTCESKAYASEIKHAINNGTKLQQEHDTEILEFVPWLTKWYLHTGYGTYVHINDATPGFLANDKYHSLKELLDFFRKQQIPQL